MKEKLKVVAFGIFCLMLITGGLQILLGGMLERFTSSPGQASFDGFERLIGLVPLSIGWLLFKQVLKDWRNNT